MIDVQSETLFPLSKGPPDHKPVPSPATLWRWALRGVRGRRLETVMVGGRRYSSREAFQRFIVGLNETLAAEPPASDLRAKQKADAARHAASTF